MLDIKAVSKPALIATACAVALTVAMHLGGGVAVLSGWLAQPVWSIAMRWWRARQQRLPAQWLSDALQLGMLWAITLPALALLLAWPLGKVRATGSLAAALFMSITLALGLIILWRLWPLYHGMARDGGSLSERWYKLPLQESSSWRGLGAAGVVLGIGVVAVAPLWLSKGSALSGWPISLIALVVWPLGHWGLQKIAGPSPAMLALDPAQFRFADAHQQEPVTTAPPQPAPANTITPAAAPVASTSTAAVPDAEQLYAAARAGRVAEALQLIEAGADVFALPEDDALDQRSLVALAAVSADLRLLRALIGKGVNLNSPVAGMTPLLAATRDSWHGRPEAVMVLLTNGANPDGCDAEGNTPLHYAVRSADPSVAALLRDAGASLDTVNLHGATPLVIACRHGNWRLVQYLLGSGAKPHVDAATPALLAAVGIEEDDATGVQLLLKHRANVNVQDEEGRSALHSVARAGHVKTAEVLIGAGINLQLCDNNGRSALMYAVQAGQLPMLERLIAAGASVQGQDKQGRNVLALACQSAHPNTEILERLLALGVDASQADDSGRKPVNIAAEAGRWSLVTLLDADYPVPGQVLEQAQHGEDAEALPDRSPFSLLSSALENNRYHGSEALIPLLADGELDSLLHLPTVQTQPQQLDWLLRHGANPDSRNAQGQSVLMQLLQQGMHGIAALERLLDRGYSAAGAGTLACFLQALLAQQDAKAQHGEAFALRLLDAGADPFAPSVEGETCLNLAVRLRFNGLAKCLLDKGINPNARGEYGMTALHLCSALGRETILRQLLLAGADLHLRSMDGQTPLGIARAAGRHDLADWLNWRGWPLPQRRLRKSDLPQAALSGDVDAVRRLLMLGFDVNSADSAGCTGLLHAAGEGHVDVVKILLAHKPDLSRPANSGVTALSAAVSTGKHAVISQLLKAGAPLEARLAGGITVLMLACAHGRADTVEFLLGAGADLHVRDEQGRGCMHCAAMYGFHTKDRARLIALFDCLLLAGAHADEMAEGGTTPLLLLLGARAEPGSRCDEAVISAGVRRLLEEHVQLDVSEARGFGPLHLAALHGMLNVTRQLLQAGADPLQLDGLGRKPREIAQMRGFVDVAAELLPPSPELRAAKPAARTADTVLQGAAADAQLSMSQLLRNRGKAPPNPRV